MVVLLRGGISEKENFICPFCGELWFLSGVLRELAVEVVVASLWNLSGSVGFQLFDRPKKVAIQN